MEPLKGVEAEKGTDIPLCIDYINVWLMKIKADKIMKEMSFVPSVQEDLSKK